jgi:tetratricopeptide (TPR) repeat protein
MVTSAHARHAAFYLDLAARNREDWRTLTAELAQLRRAWNTVVQDDELVIAFLHAIHLFQERQAFGQEYLGWAERGLAAARRLRSPGVEGTLLSSIGNIYTRLGSLEDARTAHEGALAAWTAANDLEGQAYALNNLGVVHDSLGDMRQALTYYEQALPLMREASNRGGQAAILNNMGVAHRTLGEFPYALACHAQALAIEEVIGGHWEQATTLNNIGVVYLDQEAWLQALEFLAQALPLRAAVGDRPGEAKTLNNLGRAYAALEQ